MLENLPLHIYIFIAVLLGLTVSFLVFFVIPGMLSAHQLDRVNRSLRRLNGNPTQDMSKIFKGKGILETLWKEYSDTLHPQFEVDPSTGQEKLSKIRSTLPAEVFFKQESVIDQPMLTEFFKHLPGLFTGIGIIGTFYGLMDGLNDFQVSSDVGQVHLSLNHLLQGVRHAFFVSFTAILLSMLITFIEKMMVTRLQGKLERLHQYLDGLFEGGAGEEYLARLVRASEFSAHQVEYMNTGVQGLVSHLGGGTAPSVNYEEILGHLAKNLERIMEQQANSQQQTLEALEKLVERFDRFMTEHETNARFDHHTL